MTSSSLLATSRKIGSTCILGSRLEIDYEFFTMNPLVPNAISTPVAGRTPHVAVLFFVPGKNRFRPSNYCENASPKFDSRTSDTWVSRRSNGPPGRGSTSSWVTSITYVTKV